MPTNSIQLMRYQGIPRINWPAAGVRRSGTRALRLLDDAEQTACVVDLKEARISGRGRQLVRQLIRLHRGLIHKGGVLVLARPDREVTAFLADQLPQVPCCRTLKDAKILMDRWEEAGGSTLVMSVSGSSTLSDSRADAEFILKLLGKGLTPGQTERLANFARREENSRRAQRFYLSMGGIFALLGGALLASVHPLSGGLFFASMGSLLLILAASPGLIGGEGVTRKEVEVVTKVTKELVAGTDGVFRAREDVS